MRSGLKRDDMTNSTFSQGDLNRAEATEGWEATGRGNSLSLNTHRIVLCPVGLDIGPDELFKLPAEPLIIGVGAEQGPRDRNHPVPRVVRGWSQR